MLAKFFFYNRGRYVELTSLNEWAELRILSQQYLVSRYIGNGMLWSGISRYRASLDESGPSRTIFCELRHSADIKAGPQLWDWSDATVDGDAAAGDRQVRWEAAVCDVESLHCNR